MSMHAKWLLSVIAILTVALSGCAAKPGPDAMNSLSSAQAEYSRIAEDPSVSSAAPAEKAKAEEFLKSAEALSDKRGADEEIMYLSELSTTWSQAAMAKTESAQLNERLDRTLSAQAEFARDGAKVTSRGLLLRMLNINFNTDKFAIDDTQLDHLEQLSTMMLRHEDVMLLVEGHTDGTGGMEHNLDLSVNRAKSVIDYLVEQGVDASRLSGVGYGPALPTASNNTALGRQANRRVELLINTGSMPPPLDKAGVDVAEVPMN